MTTARVLFDKRDSIALITINREAQLNALDMATLGELEAGVARANDDAGVKVIVLTGAGKKAFVAGGDIRDLNSRQGLAHYKPTIAAVNGWALGGGTELALCTDLRLAADSASFGLPEITLGLFPGAGGSQRLARQISPCKAKEMMFLGDRITAAEAERLGLINRVVPADALMAEVMKVAAAIASKSPLVLKLMKRAIRDGLEMPLHAALKHEQAMIGLVLDSRDAHEGCTAFIEKRAAQFQGV